MSAVEREVAPREPLTDEQRKMVEDNLGLVGFVIQKYGTGGLDPEDAWAEGVLGLMRAVQKFDPARARISTYAVQWIRAAIQHGYGRYMGRNYRHANGNGTGKKRHDYVAPVSLDMPVTEDGASISDLIVGDLDAEHLTDSTDTAKHMLDRLRSFARDELDLAAIHRLAAGDVTRDVLAERHGVSRQTIQNRESYLLARFRHPSSRPPVGAAAHNGRPEDES